VPGNKHLKLRFVLEIVEKEKVSGTLSRPAAWVKRGFQAEAAHSAVGPGFVRVRIAAGDAPLERGQFRFGLNADNALGLTSRCPGNGS
jgi:hypothetical protein